MTQGNNIASLYAGQLRQYAEHFEQRDWNYTRNLGRLKAIRYRGNDDDLRYRVQRAVRELFRRNDELDEMIGVGRIPMALYLLRRDPHLPDGILDGGGIITFWEETGEYLQYVQPSVGSLIADWMDADPDNPHAIRVAEEMKRINDRYGVRLAEGGVAE